MSAGAPACESQRETGSRYAPSPPRRLTLSHSAGWLAMLVVGGAFLVAEHDWRTSQADAFTQTAEQMQAAAAGGDVVRRLAYPLVGLFGLVLLGAPTARRFRVDPWLAALIGGYLGWCALSVLWSHAPGMTFRRLVILGCLVSAAAGVVRHVTSRELVWLGVVVPAFVLVIGVLAEVSLGTFRPWAGEYRFSGTLHPNTQGIHLALLCLSSACLLRGEGRWRTTLVGLFAVGFAFLLLTKLLLGLAGTWCVSAVALGMLLTGIDVEQRAGKAALLGREEQAESLTGRLPIWTELSSYVAARPLTGYGYDSFWTAEHIETVSEELEWGIREAHSSFVDGLLSVGLIGMLPACLAVFVAMLRCQRRYRATGDAVYGLLLGMFVFGLINACTESAMLMPDYFTFVAGAGLLFLATREAECRGVETRDAAQPSTCNSDPYFGSPVP